MYVRPLRTRTTQQQKLERIRTGTTSSLKKEKRQHPSILTMATPTAIDAADATKNATAVDAEASANASACWSLFQKPPMVVTDDPKS